MTTFLLFTLIYLWDMIISVVIPHEINFITLLEWYQWHDHSTFVYYGNPFLNYVQYEIDVRPVNMWNWAISCHVVPLKVNLQMASFMEYSDFYTLAIWSWQPYWWYLFDLIQFHSMSILPIILVFISLMLSPWCDHITDFFL